ncbi:MAG TPA: glycosyltransferase [Leptolyngbyaceae cyanobacterium]
MPQPTSYLWCVTLALTHPTLRLREFMPTISVVIPAFNAEKTIQETIESVLNQTFSDFELLVINDGSQDSTLDVIDNIKDERIKVFSYPNAGVAASRNRGIAQATGEYIAFLDADDLWTSDKLEAQLKALQENPQAAVAYSWTDYIDEYSQFLRPGMHVTVNGDVYAEILEKFFLENGSNFLVRKEALLVVGGFDELIFGPEDWDICIRLAAKYQFVAVPRSQILYRLNRTSNQSISSQLARQESQNLKVIEKAFQQAPDSLKSLKRTALANLYKYLTFRAIETSCDRSNSLTAARYLFNAIKYNPALLKQVKVMASAWFKIMAIAFLPPQQSRQLTIKSKKV